MFVEKKYIRVTTHNKCALGGNWTSDEKWHSLSAHQNHRKTKALKIKLNNLINKKKAHSNINKRWERLNNDTEKTSTVCAV